MPSTDPETGDDEVRDDFIVANLALWAGDYQTAERRLNAIRRSTRSSSELTSVSAAIASSATRALRQLRRRMTEYRALARSAELPEDLVEAHPSMHSSGDHLSAVMWVESEREYELRIYVHDLSWEKHFYKRGAILSGDSAALERMRELGYGDGLREDHALDADEVARRPAELGITWGFPSHQLFLHVELSDFCTCTVRGVWTERELPATVEAAVSILKLFLDEFDPQQDSTSDSGAD